MFAVSRQLGRTDAKTHCSQQLRPAEAYMNPPNETNQRADLRDYLAAERTFLAWVRTGLALMGFGFVVARFGLFLQQIQNAQHASSVQSYGLCCGLELPLSQPAW